MDGWREALKEVEAEAEADFTVPSRERDFALVVEGRYLFVDADFLATQSPVLRQLLRGPWKEATTKEAELRGERYEEILELIRCLCFAPYRGEVTEENVALLMAFASRFFIPELDRRCFQFLRAALDKTPTPSLLVLVAELGLKYGMESIAKEAFPLLARLSVSKLKELSEAGAMSAGVAASVWQAKATKLTKARLISDPHEWDEKPFRLWGASKRICYFCRRVFSTRDMDRCLRCKWDYCRRCKQWLHCPKASVAHCQECATPEKVGSNPLYVMYRARDAPDETRKPPPFKMDKDDQCSCWLKEPMPNLFKPPPLRPPPQS